MTGFKSVLVGLVLAILILAFGNFVLHIPEGAGRLALFAVAAVVFLVLAFGPGRLWGKGGTLNSFALPLLFLVNFHLSGWWIVGGLIALVWLWAATREQGSFGIAGGLAVLAALVFTGAILLGVGTGWLLK